MTRRPQRRGSIALEFALQFAALVSLCLVVAQMGLYLTEGQRFVQATFEACRFAAIAPEEPSQAEVRAHVEHVLDEMGMPTAGLDLDLSYGVDLDEEIVTVHMTLPSTSIVSLVGLPSSFDQTFVAVVIRGLP